MKTSDKDELLCEIYDEQIPDWSELDGVGERLESRRLQVNTRRSVVASVAICCVLVGLILLTKPGGSDSPSIEFVLNKEIPISIVVHNAENETPKRDNSFDFEAVKNRSHTDVQMINDIELMDIIGRSGGGIVYGEEKILLQMKDGELTSG